MSASISAPSAVAPIRALPDELHLQVFGFLTGVERVCSSGVCKKFQATAQDKKYLEDFLKVSSYPSGRWTVPQLWKLFQRKARIDDGIGELKRGVHFGELPPFIMAFSPDSQKLACSSRNGINLPLEVWEFAPTISRYFPRIDPSSGAVQSFLQTEASFSAQGLKAYIPNDKRSIQISEIHAFHEEVTGSIEIQGSVRRVQFSPDGSMIAACIIPFSAEALAEMEEVELEHLDNTYIRIWDAETLEIKATFIPASDRYSGVGCLDTAIGRSLVFSDDSSMILSASFRDNTIDVYQIGTDWHVRHCAESTSAAIVPCNTKAVYGTQDGRVVIWDFASDSIRTSAPPVERFIEESLYGPPVSNSTFRVAVSPDGNKIAWGWANRVITICDFDTPNPRPVFVSVPHTPTEPNAMLDLWWWGTPPGPLGYEHNPYLETDPRDL